MILFAGLLAATSSGISAKPNLAGAWNEGACLVAQEDAVVGVWQWYWSDPGSTILVKHGTVEFKPNGKCYFGSKEGDWTRTGTTVTITWGSSTDTLVLNDYNLMTGSNDKQMQVKGDRS